MRKRVDLPHDRLGFVGISLGAIRHWRLVLLGAVGLLLVAAMAWKRIPRLEDPRIEPSLVFVTIPYPGASPEDVEAQVVKPVEEELFSMDGIEDLDSRALPGYALITLRFEEGTAMENAAEAVRGKVLGKLPDLPPEVKQPGVSRAKSTTFTAQMVVVLSGLRSDAVLTDEAKRLEDRLAAIDGVASVHRRGTRARAVRIRLDPVRLERHHLTVADVAARIQLANVRVPGGELEVGRYATMLSIDHELENAAQVGRIAVAALAGPDGGTHTVTLADVADVRDDFRSPSERLLQDGAPAVGLELRFRAQENAVEVGRRVRAVLADETPHLPQGTRLTVAHDQPGWVQGSLSGFLESLAEGVLLVMLIITLGMGWRSAAVVAAVLPLAIAGAVFGLFVLGFALEQVSIAGLIVALGLLVDDAVVVTESVQLMRDRGISGLRAAVVGTARVFWANNGTTAVACASFIPLFFMGGDTGAFIKGLPTAVVLALVTSLLVAQLVTPWISTFVLRAPAGTPAIPDEAAFDRHQDLGAEHGERNVALRALKKAYLWAIPKVVRHPVKVIGGATALLVGAFLLLPQVGFQFFPKADKPVLFVTVELPRGTALATTAQKVAQVTEALRADPAVRSTSAVIGAAYPQIFLGRASRPQSQDFGDILVGLTGDTSATATRLRQRLAAIPGVRITVEELYHGPPIVHPINVRVEGDDYAQLTRYAESIKAVLRKVPGTINVSDTLSDSILLTRVDIDADRALRFGVTPGQVGQTLRLGHGEDRLTSFREGTDTVELVIENQGAIASADPLDRVRETPVPVAAGVAVPVLAVADVGLARGYAELRRHNTRRVVDVSADVDGGTLPSKVLAQVAPQLAKLPLERGYRYSYAGEQAETEKSFRNLGIAATATLLLIFVLLVLMFGSLTRAVIVLCAVPYALIGAIVGLWVTHTPFGFMAFLGLIALIGVYVNHKIYFVDRMQELVERGMPWPEAIAQAGIDRLRPVVLTALTAILGLLPLTLGGGVFWGAFGWVNVFGLAMSIPLSLVLLPAFIALAQRLRRAPSAPSAEAATP